MSIIIYKHLFRKTNIFIQSLTIQEPKRKIKEKKKLV